MGLPSMLGTGIKRAIPQEWLEKFGADLFQQYVRLRLHYLNGRIEFVNCPERIEYLKIDQGKPERLVFLPGFADNKENFFDPAQFLVSGFDIIVPDLPGFGKSFKDQHAHYSLPFITQHLKNFLQTIPWPDFHLIGNSLGGAAAVGLALEMPERIKSLTLVDAAGIVLPQYKSIYHEFVEGRNIFSIQTHDQFQYFLNRVFFKPPLIPPFIWEYMYAEFAKNSRWHRKMLSDVMGGIRDLGDSRVESLTINNRLREIKQPTLIVWGDEDTFFPPEVGYFIREQIPESKLYVMPDRGHAPQIEAPLQFAKIFRKFVRERRHTKK